MDQTNNIRNCQKHPNNSLEFIQVKQVNQDASKSIFYCPVCINEDLSFKGLDYLLINQIESQGDKQILQKWPPVNDQQIIDQLIQTAANSQSNTAVEHSITNFFTFLKSEISNRIDTCQKKMINLVKDQSFDGDSILQKYQDISKIGEFRKLLLSGNQADLYQKEQSCKQFIMSVEEKKDINTQLLQDLLNSSKKKQSLINFEFPNQIKESILTFIDQINFFDQDETKNTSSHNISNTSLQSQSNNFTEKIMKLISNKSNFCSDQFLNEVRTKLSKLNVLLQSISFENQFEENKSPIVFDGLTNEQLSNVKNHVQHLVELKRDQEFKRKVMNSEQIKQMNRVLKNQANFLNNNFINQFEEYLVETYPYLINANFNRMITDEDKFKDMCSLSNETLDHLLKLSQKMNKPNNQLDNNNYQKLITKIKPIINSHFLHMKQNDIDNIISTYPIFDLLQQPEVKDIMPDIQLEKGKWNGGEQNLIITKLNNQIEVQNSLQGNSNTISNIILEKDKKYIFRFQVQRLDQGVKQFMIGLMQAQDQDIKDGFLDKLSCFFKLEANSNEIFLYPNGNYGIYKDILGKGLKMNCENGDQIELRVCIQEQVLEVVDYPNYNYKIGLCDEYKQNLINHQNLKLYIFQQFQSFKVILKSALIVKEFNE